MKYVLKWRKITTLLVISIITSGLYLAIKLILFHFKTHFVSSINVNEWIEKKNEICDGNFTGYGNQFAVLNNVTVMPRVSEFCFSTACDNSKLSSYRFEYGKEGTHMDKWLTSIKQCSDTTWWSNDVHSHGGIAVIVQRYEYLNLYHTMTDWYNVFLVMKLLNLSKRDVTVILMDKNRPGYFDVVWETLFNEVLYWNTSRPLHFKQVVWNILGYESPMNYHEINNLPFADSFSNFFIQRHGITHSRTLDCKNISVLISFRRDYYFSQDTPIRILKRKISNEKELVEYFKKKYRNFHLLDLQLDQLPFHDQLKIITNTDLLISMHGAGLSHIMFMPKHSGVIELFPLYWTKFSTHHFKAFARWRGLKYNAYQNWNSANEFDNYKTYIPPPALDQNVQLILSQMCRK